MVLHVPTISLFLIGFLRHCLMSLGILYPVESSDWGAPIVVVLKSNSSLRICGDYKMAVNPALMINQYPLPLSEDIFSTLEGGVLFTKMDLSQAYLQLELDPPSKELSTINTPFGLYRHNRLPFGIASASGKFQRVMDDLFRDLPWVKCYWTTFWWRAGPKRSIGRG